MGMHHGHLLGGKTVKDCTFISGWSNILFVPRMLISVAVLLFFGL